MTYRFLPHTADIRVAIEGDDLNDIFTDALALVRELVAGPSDAGAVEERPLTLSASGPDELLLQFIRELLYWFNTEAFVPASVEIASLSPEALRAVVRGEPFQSGRHAAQPEVKAVTRHQLVVRPVSHGWHAEVVFDL